MPLSTDLCRLESSNPKKKFSKPGYFIFGRGQSPHLKKKKLHFFLFKISIFFSLNLHGRSGISRTERKTRFLIFIFQVIIIFIQKKNSIFYEFSPKTQKINCKKNVFHFWFYSAHSISFIKIWPLLSGGWMGICKKNLLSKNKNKFWTYISNDLKKKI